MSWRLGWGLVVAAALLGGCHLNTAPTTPNATAKPAPKPVVIPHYQTDLPSIAPQAQPVADHVADFTWHDGPTAAEVPPQAVSGRLGGHDFICRYASVTPDHEEHQPVYWLRFSDQPRGADCSFASDDNSVSVEWHQPLALGEWLKKFGEEAKSDNPTAAWYTVQPPGIAQTPDGNQPPGSGPSPTVWQPQTMNTCGWSVYLKIDEERGSTQDGGIASLRGKIALVFDDGDKKSWIAGSFVADGCRNEP